jgi:mannose/fructose/N-acetylgalactosamine-specific phosphotransferase system component IIB
VSVVLARVDDRLLHGQVLLGWGCSLDADRYLVVDDVLAESAFERALVESCGGDCPVEILTAADGGARVVAEQGRPGHAIVLVRGVTQALALVRAVRAAGGTLDVINLGGMHHAVGKERVHDYVYLDGADRAALGELAALGVRVRVQDVPAATPFDAPPAWAARVA